ncbi:MAG TPA: acyltransferase [Roseiflexaceae bacterium]|nr:acyltransferase [Roseiflexaceae bacterium]HMP40685.1 acyltransferase [Roseiflexaceae bacterium]
MNPLLFVLVFFAPPPIKLWLLRTFCGAQIGRGARIGWFAAVAARHLALGEASEIRSLTIIQCGGDLHIGRYAIVSSFTLVYGAGDLIIGEHAYVGPQSLINCDEPVRLGRYSAVGARTMIYTHGSFLPFTEGFWVRFGGVTIGDYVWCAAGVFIHPGVTIGDEVFINSRSVVTGNIASGTVAEGFPAQPITTMARVRRNMTPRRVDAAISQMLRHFNEAILARQYGISAEQDAAGSLHFTFRGAPYQICCIPAAGIIPPLDPARRLLLLINRSDWQPPAAVVAQADFISMQSDREHDPVFHELIQFFKRYYGIQFRYRN